MRETGEDIKLEEEKASQKPKAIKTCEAIRAQSRRQPAHMPRDVDAQLSSYWKTHTLAPICAIQLGMHCGAIRRCERVESRVILRLLYKSIGAVDLTRRLLVKICAKV